MFFSLIEVKGLVPSLAWSVLAKLLHVGRDRRKGRNCRTNTDMVYIAGNYKLCGKGRLWMPAIKDLQCVDTKESAIRSGIGCFRVDQGIGLWYSPPRKQSVVCPTPAPTIRYKLGALLKVFFFLKEDLIMWGIVVWSLDRGLTVVCFRKVGGRGECA